jgi:uncharacterized membrane protein
VGGLHFLSPWWLAALALVPLAAWLARRSLAGLGAARRWTALVLRLLLVTAAVLALAEAGWKQVSREVSVVYLLDRSASIDPDEGRRALQYVRDTSERRESGGRQADDLGGLVVFAERASVELAPSAAFTAPSRMHSLIATEASDLAEGLRLAAASFPAGTRRRVVLISDGLENRGLATEEARRLAELGVRVEVLPLQRLRGPEVMVERLVVREHARAGEPVQVRALLRADQAAAGELELVLDGNPVARRRFQVAEAGKTSHSFELNLPGPGFYPVEIRLRPDPGCDTVPQNNTGHAFTQLQGQARVLILFSPAGKDDATADVAHLARALAQEKIEVRLAGPGEVPASPAELAGYDCLIVANLGAYAFTGQGMSAVRAAVRDLGMGLVMIGGPEGFGAGGYLNTPIEEALPVSCEVRQRKVMPNGALALIMHTCEMPDPNYWGKRISSAAIDALSDQDEAGLIYYDWNSGCKWLFPLQPIGPARQQMHGLIKDASPGDMPDFDSSMGLALKSLSAAKAAMKHCIIISDGDPSLADITLPGKFKSAGITVSTVAIAPHDGGCGTTLQNIASATKGRFYFAKSANELPQIFVKEAMTVRRSVVFQERFVPRQVLETDLLKGFWGAELPPLEGYVVTTAKDRAEVPITVRIKDNPEDPVLAHWRYGEGKAVAFTSSAASNWAPRWIDWPGYVKFWSQLVRWASRAGGTGDLQVRAEIRGGAGHIVTEAVDENGRLLNQLDLVAHVVDPLSREVPGVTMAQTGPGRYEARFPAGPAGVYQVNVSYRDAAGVRRNHVSGASCSFSPEFGGGEGGQELLQEISRLTGGDVLTGEAAQDRAVIWKRNLPPGYRVHPGWHWLLWAVLLLFPLDVAVRRLMLDWRAIGQRLRQTAALLVPALRPAAAAGPDSVMSALMAEKQRIREAAPAPQTENVRSRFLEQLRQAGEEAAPGSADLALQEMLQRHRERPAAPPGRAPAAPPRPAGISGYAASLLDAKKRAIKEREQEKEGKKPGNQGPGGSKA